MSFAALVAATRLMKETKETARGRITSDGGVGTPVRALAAWEVGSAVGSAVDHLLQDFALRAAATDESDRDDLTNPFEAPADRGDPEYVITLLTALRDAFDSAGPGGAVQVEPMKPMLKASGTKRLKLKYNEPLSTFDFNFNFRHYTPVPRPR